MATPLALSFNDQASPIPDFDKLSGAITREFVTKIDASEIAAVVTLMTRLRELFAIVTPETIKSEMSKVLNREDGNILQVSLQAINKAAMYSEVRERITYEVTSIITQMAASVRLVADLSEIAALQPPAPAAPAPRPGRPFAAPSLEALRAAAARGASEPEGPEASAPSRGRGRPAGRKDTAPRASRRSAQESLEIPPKLISNYFDAVSLTMDRFVELHPDQKDQVQSAKAMKYLPDLLKTLIKIAPFFYKACQDTSTIDEAARPSIVDARIEPVLFKDLCHHYLEKDLQRKALAQALYQYFAKQISLGSINSTLAYCTGELLENTQADWRNNKDGIQDFQLEEGRPLRDLLV